MSCFSPVGASESIALERQQLTAALLDDWLCWAGSRLLAMPSERIKPSLPKAIWPDYAIEQFQVLEFRKKPKFRIPPPSKDEIPIIDEIILLPNLIEDRIRRMIVHSRMLVNPISGNHIRSWNMLAKKFHSNNKIIQAKYNAGLEEICFKIPRNQMHRLQSFFDLNGNL